jgi:predicted Zn-dependent protease
MERKDNSIFYRLGRRAAPAWLKARWMWQTLAGDEKDRIRAERELGLVLDAIYRRRATLSDDRAAVDRLRVIAQRLRDRLSRTDWEFTIRCECGSAPNALALPGGFVFFTTPLVALCGENDEELAFVMAHEIGHIVRGHAARRFLTSALLTALARTRAGRDPVTGLAANLFGELLKKGYSREQEREADEFAVRLLKSARYDPVAGVRLLSRLVQTPDGGESRGYFSTHPSIRERIERIEQLAAE